MIAPRKKLWSTPISALDHIESWITLQPSDCVCDIGCGDGRIILGWAERYSQSLQTQLLPNDGDAVDERARKDAGSPVASFLGIDIDPDRIKQSQIALEKAKSEGRIHPCITVTFHCANALESFDSLASRGNIFFLYLIPRGLKIIKPLLLEHKDRLKERHQEQEKRQQQPNQDTDSNEQHLKVIAYMSPLPGEIHVSRELCRVEHQPEAAWPLYLYYL